VAVAVLVPLEHHLLLVVLVWQAALQGQASPMPLAVMEARRRAHSMVLPEQQIQAMAAAPDLETVE
jgi:hypothetical protein